MEVTTNAEKGQAPNEILFKLHSLQYGKRQQLLSVLPV